ncbi:hypothetical protein [Flavobacterium sp. UBA6046]|jgi:alpha 1,2-mannosyltransferase|uniref:hypothetical protein n=1 Tax=Flavobacterium sp. UBA6046 TaxID=1946552 RepID=UPI0025C288C6|nr:hypothetical protein [Flavobacterium sp. UBA6046]
MSHSTFHKSGTREIDIEINDDAIKYLRTAWQDYVKKIGDYPASRFDGKGIVLCAGGIRYFTCAWIIIKQLKAIGCNLQIELWFSADELSKEMILQLESLNVICKNFLDYTYITSRGLMLKPLAIFHSQFKEILFLDADNTCLVNPEFLFETHEYLNSGAIFWPDFWKTAADNPIWQIVENEDYLSPEQESGQILIDKQKCWKELNLCLHFNENHEIYYQLLFGDKDTFKFAWLALKSNFYMIQKEVATCGFIDAQNTFRGITMVQHSVSGEMLFLHRNLLKWDITKPGEKVWEKIKAFKHNAINKEYVNTGYAMDFRGDYLEYSVSFAIQNLEMQCLEILQELRSTDFYTRFLIESHL